MSNNDIDESYETDDELSPEAKQIGMFLEQRDRTMNAISDPRRILDIKKAYERLVELSDGDNVKISYRINEPFKNMGYISVNGREIDFDNPSGLFNAIASADNLEIYPKTDGTVTFELTFQNVAKYF